MKQLKQNTSVRTRKLKRISPDVYECAMLIYPYVILNQINKKLRKVDG